MLKCVVFAVTEYGFACLSEKRSGIERTLGSEGVKTVFLAKGDGGFLLKERQGPSYSGGDYEKYGKEELLFLTDDADILSSLLREKYYAIGMYHDRNQDVCFQGTLYAVEDVEQLTFQAYDQAYRRLAGLPWEILETERLAVRESTVEDVKDFYRIYREPSITYYMENLFQDPDEEAAYMESYIRQIYGFYGFGMWTVLLKSSGRVIGRAGLNVREGYELPELGFVIGVPYQGRGYAYEVCGAVLSYAKEQLQFEKVQALVQEGNEASNRLLDKLGFAYERNIVENGQEYKLMIKKL